MSILARIQANGGEIVRDEWRFSLRRGRLSAAALVWLRSRWLEACGEAWSLFGAWAERAAIREFDGGQTRLEAERAAYEEITSC